MLSCPLFKGQKYIFFSDLSSCEDLKPAYLQVGNVRGWDKICKEMAKASVLGWKSEKNHAIRVRSRPVTDLFMEQAVDRQTGRSGPEYNKKGTIG
jgi:hypothetical protein